MKTVEIPSEYLEKLEAVREGRTIEETILSLISEEYERYKNRKYIIEKVSIEEFDSSDFTRQITKGELVR